MMNALLSISFMLALSLQSTEPDVSIQSSPEIIVVEKSWSKTRFRPGWDRQIIFNPEANPTNPGRTERRRMGRPVEGYTYKAKVKNSGKKTVVLVGWDYTFTDSDSKKQTHHQFYTRIKIASGKQKEIAQFTRVPPTRTVSATSVIVEEVVINYIQYEDGRCPFFCVNPFFPVRLSSDWLSVKAAKNAFTHTHKFFIKLLAARFTQNT